MTIFGTSAKYIDAVKKTGWQPKLTHRLQALRSMLSTGSPLSPKLRKLRLPLLPRPQGRPASSFDFGRTDICGCFVGGNPFEPVWRGEIQGPMLGIGVDVYDEAGHPCATSRASWSA